MLRGRWLRIIGNKIKEVMWSKGK